MPEKEEYQKGHRYPYFSCELLCSINGFNINKLLKMPLDFDKKEIKDNIEDNKDKNVGKKNIENNNNEENTKEGDTDIKSMKEEKPEEKRNIKEEEKMDLEDEEYQIYTKPLKDKKNDEPNYSLVNSILDYFFSFLKEKSSLDNYVLMGYFNKITNYLIKNKTKIILDYILIKRENVINLLLSHINRYSIANIITNLLNSLSDDNTPDANDKYKIIVNKLLDQLNLIENDDNVIEIICDLIINCIIYNNKIKLSKMTDACIINKFENIIQKYFEKYEYNKTKIIFVINLITKMNKSILSNFSSKITTTTNSDDTKNEMMNLIKFADKSSNQFTSLNNSRFDFKELVYKSFLNSFSNYCNSINNICIIIIEDLIKQEQNQQNNAEDEIETSYSSKKSKKLGINKIIEFEYIKTVLDIYINSLAIFNDNVEKKNYINEKIHLISETKIFKLFIDYYFKFQNNFFTNIMLDVIKIIFDNDKAPEELIINFLQLNNEGNNFITLLIDDIVRNTKFIFENSNNKMNNILFGSNINILNYIFSSKNNYMKKICNEKMTKEKFFYDNLITNINYIFSKRLYKIDDNTDSPKFDFMGVRITTTNEIQGESDIPFSLESLDELITFYLKVNEKYLAGEDFISLFKERENKLKEIQNSNEYIRLSNQIKDEESETEEEDDEYDDEDIPKPVFFNSKLEEKKEEEKKEEKKTSNLVSVENTNIDENKNVEENKNIDENKNTDENNNIKNVDENKNIESQKYNDINFWHTEIKDENMEKILEELL